MEMKVNNMVVDITRQENFPEEHFGKFLEIIEQKLQGKENKRTAKETKEVIGMVILKKFPLNETLEDNIKYFKTDEVERTYMLMGKEKKASKKTKEYKIKSIAEHIASIIEDCLIDNGGFLMWWNKEGEYKDSETAKFSNKMATLSEEDMAECNFGW